MVKSLNPGVSRLDPNQYIDIAAAAAIDVEIVTQLNGRKKWIAYVRYPDLSVNSAMLVDRLQHVLGSSLTTTRRPCLWYKRKRCAQILVNGERILFGEEGFRVAGNHFCSPPDQKQVVLSACRLGHSEAVKMQKILRSLGYYVGPDHEGFELDPKTNKCVYEWEMHSEVRQALMKFQNAVHLPPDGKFGRNTRVYLRRAAEKEGVEY